MINCKCAILYDDENNIWCCSVTDDRCIFPIPNDIKCYNGKIKKKRVLNNETNK